MKHTNTKKIMVLIDKRLLEQICKPIHDKIIIRRVQEQNIATQYYFSKVNIKKRAKAAKAGIRVHIGGAVSRVRVRWHA